MDRIILPNTDLSLSRLSFGTTGIFHFFSAQKRQDLLAKALDCGFTHIDTSPYYGFGIAETVLGTLSNTQKYQITVASKLGLYGPKNISPSTIPVFTRKVMGKLIKSWNKPIVDWSLETAKASLAASLKRLNRDYLDILFLHEPLAQFIQTEEWQLWLEQCQQKGLIRYWGVAGENANIQAMLEQHPTLCTVVQTRDSLQQDMSWLTSQRPFQMTYGYLMNRPNGLSVKQVLEQALQKNTTGSILVSTRRPEHIPMLASVMKSA